MADSNAYYSVYESNLEAEAEAASAAITSGSFGFHAMDDPGGGDPCTITNDASVFYVTAESGGAQIIG